jgi:hypothetical protein
MKRFCRYGRPHRIIRLRPFPGRFALKTQTEKFQEGEEAIIERPSREDRYFGDIRGPSAPQRQRP